MGRKYNERQSMVMGGPARVIRKEDLSSGKPGDREIYLDANVETFDQYLIELLHEGLKTLILMGIILIPLFFILDYYTMPADLLRRFGFYRLISVSLILLQYFIIRNSKPTSISVLHAYLITLNVGGIIAQMTVDLGGFDARYYAGLNLVIIGVNLLMPWKAAQSAANSILVIGMYVVLNVMEGQPYDPEILTNNFFFLFATGVIAANINYLRHNLVKKEFNLLLALQNARDALWSEMELAKRIQTALLPEQESMEGYEIAASMLPASEVGGDYYDILDNGSTGKWVTIGDVSGHGVDSGLIMMMAETAIISAIHNLPAASPSKVLEETNHVIRENLSRLGSDHYMTMMALHIEKNVVTFAGKHQDIIVYRSALNKTEVVASEGTWLGISDTISSFLPEQSLELLSGDIMLLFTDGITEASNDSGHLFGQARLEQELNRYADLHVGKLLDKIVESVQRHQKNQFDDMTLIVLKKS